MKTETCPTCQKKLPVRTFTSKKEASLAVYNVLGRLQEGAKYTISDLATMAGREVDADFRNGVSYLVRTGFLGKYDWNSYTINRRCSRADCPM